MNLYLDGRARKLTVHGLVAEAFIGPRPIGVQVNHIDGDRTNNSATNLEYCTDSENKRHAVSIGLGAVGGRNAATKLTDDEVRAVRAACGDGMSQRDVAQRFGVSQGHVSDIVRGRKRRLL